ncbi:MAG: hypothetical protein WC821_02800 [archaeon]|jgi:type II secretory pathway component PulC
MKGFIFSTEALLTLIIIILATSVFWYTSSFQVQSTNNIQIQAQSDRAMTLYFDQNESLPNILATTQYCSKVIYYRVQSKQLLEKFSCRWIE